MSAATATCPEVGTRAPRPTGGKATCPSCGRVVAVFITSEPYPYRFRRHDENPAPTSSQEES